MRKLGKWWQGSRIKSGCNIWEWESGKTRDCDRRVMHQVVRGECLLIRSCLRFVLTRMRGFGAWLVGLDVSPEAVLISNVANLPEHSVLVLVTIASLHLMRSVALLLFPLFVSLVIDDFVSILVWVELVVLVILVVLQCWKMDYGVLSVGEWLLVVTLVSSKLFVYR